MKDMRCLYVCLASVSGLLAMPVSALAQDLDRKVSFSHEAARASVLLPALSRAAGVTFTATTRMSDEVLIINVHDVALRDLMRKVADVSQGEWKPQGEGFELSRSSSLQTQFERSELAERAKLVQSKLDSELGRIAKLPAFTAQEADRLAAQQQKANDNFAKSFTNGDSGGGAIRIFNGGITSSDGTPSERGILAILQTIGAASLASLGDGKRVVFASNPNSMQRQFPGRAHDLISRFVTDSLLFAAAGKKYESDETGQIRIASASAGDTGDGNPALGIGRSILTIQRFGNSLRASLVAADPTGASLASGQYSLEVPNLLSPTPGASNEGEKIKLSPLATEFANANKPVVSSTGDAVVVGGSALVVMSTGSSMLRLSLGDSGVKQIPISDALRARLLDPDKFDPQSLAVSEGLNALAVAKKENLVANVSDDAIMPLTRDLGKGISTDAFFKTTCPSAGIAFQEKDGWLLAMSSTPTESRLRRMDRRALGLALRGLDAQTCLRLNQLCNFALAQPKAAISSDYDGVAMNLINAAGANDALGMLGQADVLRFFGSLSQGQQDGLLAGRALSLSNIPPTAMSYLSSEVFQSFSGPNRKSPSNTETRFVVHGSVSAINQERTEYMPGGIPNAGTVQLKLDRQLGALGIDEEGKLAIYTADDLASRLYQAEHKDMTPFGSPAKLDKFLPATQAQLALHFEFPQLADMDRQLTDTLVDRSQPAVSYDGLPAELKAKIAENLKTMNGTFGTMKLDFFGRGGTKTNIPPAP